MSAIAPLGPPLSKPDCSAPVPADGAGVGGIPAWRLALKRPREELTPKERALDKVSRYLDKFGDLFLRPAQRKALEAAREKEVRKVACFCGWRVVFYVGG